MCACVYVWYIHTYTYIGYKHTWYIYIHTHTQDTIGHIWVYMYIYLFLWRIMTNTLCLLRFGWMDKKSQIYLEKTQHNTQKRNIQMNSTSLCLWTSHLIERFVWQVVKINRRIVLNVLHGKENTWKWLKNLKPAVYEEIFLIKWRTGIVREHELYHSLGQGIQFTE